MKTQMKSSFDPSNHTPEKNYTKEYNLYYIGSSLMIIFSIILGAFLLHTYLRSIDALMLFSSGLINDFISLSLVSFIFISTLFLLFSTQYWTSHLIYNNMQLKSKKLINLRDKKTRKLLIFNIPILLLISCIMIYIIAFNKSDYDDSFVHTDDYHKLFSLYCIFIYSIVILFLLTFCKNWSYYKRLRFFLNYRKYDGFIGHIKCVFPYVLGIFTIFALFLHISLFFIMLFGMHEINDVYDLLKPLYYILIIYVTFILMPIDYVDTSLKSKFYKVFSFSLLCFFLISIPSYFLETRYTNNLMRVIGKADSKITKYVIMNANKYGLTDETNTIFTGTGKVLWRDDKYEIFLPEENINDLSKRKIIEKKDIYLFQGNSDAISNK